MNACSHQRTVKDVPLVANISKSEVIPPQMPQHVSIAATQAAVVTRYHTVFFIEISEEGNVYLSGGTSTLPHPPISSAEPPLPLPK